MIEMVSKHQVFFLIFLLTFTTAIGQNETAILSAVDVTYDNQCLLKDQLWMKFTENCTIDDDLNRNVILIGYLGSFDIDDDGSGKLISGAIPEAIERINKDPKILPNQLLRYVTDDAGRHPHWSPMRSMTKMRDFGVTAFVGLEQSCEKEASLAAAFNMALVSYRCADALVSDKNKYPTFARTLPPASKISSALLSTILKFNWKQITIVADNYSADYKEIEDSLKYDIKYYNLRQEENKPPEKVIKVTKFYSLPRNYLRTHNSELHAIVDDSYKNTRIYIFLGDYHPLIGFATILENATKDNFKDYVILAAEKDEMYDANEPYQYCLREYDNAVVSLHDQNLTESEYHEKTIGSQNISACSSILVLAPTPENAEVYDNFVERVWKQNEEFPIKLPLPSKHLRKNIKMPIYAALAYDAVNVLARAFHQVVNVDHESKYDGKLIVRAMEEMEYDSILGPHQTMDANADADGHYALLSLQIDPVKKMMPVARFNKRNCTKLETPCIPKFQYIEGRTILWNKGQVPEDGPKCGFRNEKCTFDPHWKWITLIVVCCCSMVVCFVFVFKHYRYEQKLAALLWKIDVKDVIIPRTNSEHTLQQLRSAVNFPNVDWTRFASYANAVKPGYDVESIQHGNETGAGFFKGNVVFVKRINKKNIDLTRNLRKELIQVKELRHENINPFIGASVESPNICILTLYCARGSLEDVLANEDITMDQMFIASLVADLIKGMIYLHDSEIGSHGNLKSSNCLVDSRWVLQISDFGLHEFKAGQEVTGESEKRHLKGLLWRAPELLRMMSPPPQGTQKGDVYSFAIILYEIIGRKGPWATDLPIKTILDKVTNAQYEVRPFRPPLDKLSCDHYVIKTMEESWAESPDSRPDFRFINILLRDLQSGLKPNIFDNMIAIMERHALNLEDLVKERTKQLFNEKKRTEMLLLRMLPKTVADQLTRGDVVEPVSFNSVTIYFSDIVGFTELSAVSTPFEVVDLLNDLYTCFDSIIENYDVYKVETIGDAYMVVSGLPQHNGDKHAGEVASMALHLLSEIQNFEIRHRPKERLKLRIGIHSGSCVAGVVGHKMPRYCLFGDTVCTASRMESSGEGLFSFSFQFFNKPSLTALKIHVSEACKNVLEHLGGYILQERGLVSIKGKGMMRTYWLIGKQSTKIENNSLQQCNGKKLNDLSSGFCFNNGRDGSRSINKNPYIFNGLNKNLVTRTSSLGDETCGSVEQAFLNQGFDHTSDTSDTDENDEQESFNISHDGRGKRALIDMETSLMRGIARGSMKMPRKYGSKNGYNNFLSANHITAAF